MSIKSVVAGIALFAIGGFVGKGDLEQAQREQAEYCARVVAGVHTDYDNLCPVGSYNSYRGLPGDVACLGDGTCTGGEG